jgi:outer membrane protein OmpA-like peptidoglycan-associated protein
VNRPTRIATGPAPLARPRAGARLRGCALLALAFAGCAHAKEVDSGIVEVQHRLDRVLSAGAYYCAPRELALARAHLEFARADLQQGNAREAGDHLAEASLNARAAERLSPASRCAGATSTVVVEAPRADGPDADSDGVADDTDACPRQAEDQDGYQDADGCPDADNDQDGVIDALDRCPNQPEDADEYQDSDGCPEADNDQDGVADADDRCPIEPGTAANRGCPRLEYTDIELTPTALRIKRPVLFGDDTPAIRSVSFGLLDGVVAVLNEHPEVKLEIQGHTDSRGDDSHNLKLSQARADAVRRYLTDHGVEASRLTARGYGETRPIESNQTSQGREINRRVEFVRTDVAK